MSERQEPYKTKECTHSDLKAEFRRRLNAKIRTKGKSRRMVTPQPRYDDVFFEGLERLNKIASGEIDG